MKVAINGLGRIGRCLARAIHETECNNIELTAINCSSTPEQSAHFLQYDSVHGRFQSKINFGDDWIDLGKGKISMYNHRTPEMIPWGEIDLIFECTGVFKTKSDASRHFQNANARYVIISAPSPDPDCTIIYGVNNEDLRPDHRIISVGSCTTNCLTPLVKILHNNIGIECGFATTIHSYTNDQKILDSNHKDVQRARACNMSIIPTSTGAAKAVGMIIPELDNKISGTALRVPTPNVSLVDFKCVTQNKTDKEQIIKMIQEAIHGDMKNVISICREKLVSIDFNHDTHSCVIDENSIEILNQGKFCRIASWYDNEWGFVKRMLDVAELIQH